MPFAVMNAWPGIHLARKRMDGQKCKTTFFTDADSPSDLKSAFGVDLWPRCPLFQASGIELYGPVLRGAKPIINQRSVRDCIMSNRVHKPCKGPNMKARGNWVKKTPRGWHAATGKTTIP